jgi:ABC-type polysaccharide/polyol phosphate transport system ATPase subunit
MPEIDLAFERVSKRYRIPADSSEESGSMAARLRRRLSRPPNYFIAVHDLDFKVPRGQALGIIGHNGAGKSTILKLLSGITSPSAGSIMVRGRIAALLEVGSGFHPELTGRENVFLSGSILGMTRTEIHSKLESIIEFAEIRRFIDVPVKRYSSGMYVRLGFSIAAHLEPDILLLDEVLAVGDAKFQAKSKQRILELKQAGTTIVFISHDLHAVQQVCDRVLVIQKGNLIYDGEPHAAVSAYEQSGRLSLSSRVITGAGAAASITSLELLDKNRQPVRSISTGSPLLVRMKYMVHAPLADARLITVFHTPDWQLACVFTTGFGLHLPEGPGTVEFSCEEFALQPGLYLLDPAVEQADNSDPVARIPDCAVVQVTEGPVRIDGTFFHPHQWSLVSGTGGQQTFAVEHSVAIQS